MSEKKPITKITEKELNDRLKKSQENIEIKKKKNKTFIPNETIRSPEKQMQRLEDKKLRGGLTVNEAERLLNFIGFTDLFNLDDALWEKIVN